MEISECEARKTKKKGASIQNEANQRWWHQNNICSCKESRTKQQMSGGCLKWLCSCKWRGGGLDEHLAEGLSASLSCYQESSVLYVISSTCQSDSGLLSVDPHPLNSLSACLSSLVHPFLVRPSAYLGVFLSLCGPAVGID